MKSTRAKILIIESIIIVIALVVYITVSHKLSMQKSVDINVEYLSPIVDDLKEILYVEKFTDNESVAIALGKSEDDSPYVFVLWDDWNRYTYRPFFKPHVSEFYMETKPTEFGQPYFYIFPNPTDSSMMINGNQHEVFKFNATIDGVKYDLGFCCGLNTKNVAAK